MTKMKNIALAAALLCATPAASAQTDYLARARALHKQALLIDGHNDYPWALREKDPARDLIRERIERLPRRSTEDFVAALKQVAGK